MKLSFSRKNDEALTNYFVVDLESNFQRILFSLSFRKIYHLSELAVICDNLNPFAHPQRPTQSTRKCFAGKFKKMCVVRSSIELQTEMCAFVFTSVACSI